MNNRKHIDPETLYDLTIRGLTKKEMATELDVSIPTLSSRIRAIQRNQGLILQYRQLQNLQLTELQHKILEAVTPEKIEEASLRDLVVAYKVLKDKELSDTGRPSDVKGLIHYLVQAEKEEYALNAVQDVKDSGYTEVEVEEEDLIEDNDWEVKLPNL